METIDKVAVPLSIIKGCDFMPCVAEFGIIEKIDRNKDYSDYEPQEYNCIQIDDDALNSWWPRLIEMKSYFHCCSRPETALTRYGVTLIPPESLELFYDIVEKETDEEFIAEVSPLLAVIEKASREYKFMIHFGV